MEIKVSVIIPVYNVEKYLGQCLDSVLNQTLKEIEVICVNDGSTDGSQKILEEYAAKDSRITIINQKNKGVASARNFGISISRGEYIAFIDSDDWVALDFYEKLYNSAIQYNADSAIGNTLYFWSKDNIKDDCWVNKYVYESKSKIVESIEAKSNIIYSCSVWNKIYKTGLIKRYGLKFIEGLLIEDVPFTFNFALIANKFVLVKDANLYYRQHETSIMATIFSSEKIFDIFKIYDECDRILSSSDLDKIQKNSFSLILDNFKIFNLYSYYSTCDTKYKKLFEKKFLSVLKRIKITSNPYITDETKIIYKKALQNKFFKNVKRILTTIFSINNSEDKKHKVITILGIKISMRRF